MPPMDCRARLVWSHQAVAEDNCCRVFRIVGQGARDKIVLRVGQPGQADRFRCCPRGTGVGPGAVAQILHPLTAQMKDIADQLRDRVGHGMQDRGGGVPHLSEQRAIVGCAKIEHLGYLLHPFRVLPLCHDDRRGG